MNLVETLEKNAEEAITSFRHNQFISYQFRAITLSKKDK